MPKVPFDAFSKQIRSGDIPPAIYLYGDEDVLKDEAVKAVLDRVVDPGLRDFNYDVRGAGQIGRASCMLSATPAMVAPMPLPQDCPSFFTSDWVNKSPMNS